MEAMTSFYNMSADERAEMGRLGREHVKNNYNLAQYSGLWYQTFKDVFDNMGSWEERKNHKSWEMFEL